MKLIDVLLIYGVLLFFPASVYAQDDIWVPSDHPEFTHPEYENVWAVSFIDSVNGWALVHGVDQQSTEMRRILHTTDGGKTWTLRYQDTEALFYGIHFINDTHGWLSGSGKASITTDGGFTWRQSIFNNVYAYDGFDVFFVDSLNGWICCAGGWIYHSSDGGLHWEEQHSGTTVWLQEIHFLTPDLGFAAGTYESYGSDIIKTTDGGEHWEKCFYTRAQILDMYVIDSLNIWAPGRNGAVFNTTDGGIHWNGHPIAGGHALSCISFKDRTFGWVGAEDGFTAYTLDGGETWIPQPASTFQGFNDIAVLGRESACIVGWGSVFLQYNGSVKPTILDVTDTIANTKESYFSTIHSLGRPSPKYTLLQGPDNMKMDAPSGLLSWQAPGVKDTGAYHITVRAENPAGIDELRYTLHLKYVNHPPQINVFPGNPKIETFVHTTIVLRAFAFDIDEDTLSSKWLVNQISFTGSVDSSGVHYIMFTPDSAGSYTLSFVTSDKEFSREFTWTVNVLGTVSNIGNKFFPHHLGDTWAYQYQDGMFFDMLTVRIISDSTDALGNANIRYARSTRSPLNPPGSLWFEYQKIDTAGNIFFGENTTYLRLQFKAAAQLGEGWWTGFDSAFVSDTSKRSVFDTVAVPARRIGHIAGSEGYGETYAEGFGMISRLGDYAFPGQLTLRGAKIGEKIFGDATLVNVAESDLHLPPGTFELLQNYPNPFNPTTTIQYALPRRSYVTLTVFNTLGQQITTLVKDDIVAGNHSVQFNASNLPSGVYLYRLQAGSFVETKKLILLR